MIREAKDLLIKADSLPTESKVLMQVYGRYHLDHVYNLREFQITQDEQGEIRYGRHSLTSQVYTCKEQDDSGGHDPQTTYHDRRVVITQSCLLIFKPMISPSHGQLEFWATLQSLERIRRNLNNPTIVALQWRMKSAEQQPSVTILKIGDSKEQVDEFIQCVVTRMKEMGVAYQKNVNKNHKIAESEVSSSSIAKMDIERILSHISEYEAAIAAGELDISTV